MFLISTFSSKMFVLVSWCLGGFWKHSSVLQFDAELVNKIYVFLIYGCFCICSVFLVIVGRPTCVYCCGPKYVSFGFVPCLPLETSLIYGSEEFLSGWFCRLNVD